MAFDDSAYKSSVEAALAAAHGKGVQTTDTALAQAMADALKTAVSQLEV